MVKFCKEIHWNVAILKIVIECNRIEGSGRL